MGAECAGCHSHSNRRAKQGMDIETYPDDIVDYSPNSRPNLPALKFDAMLSNIKVVNSPKVYFLVNEVFVIPEVLHWRDRGGAPTPETSQFWNKWA